MLRSVGLEQFVGEEPAVPAQLAQPRELERALVEEIALGFAEVVDQLVIGRVDPAAVDEQVPGEIERRRRQRRGPPVEHHHVVVGQAEIRPAQIAVEERRRGGR
jgi:hypothetical protein